MRGIGFQQWREFCNGLIDNSPPVPERANSFPNFWTPPFWAYGGYLVSEYLPFAIYWRAQLPKLLSMSVQFLAQDFFEAFNLINQLKWKYPFGTVEYLNDLTPMADFSYDWYKYEAAGIDDKVMADIAAHPDYLYIDNIHAAWNNWWPWYQGSYGIIVYDPEAAFSIRLWAYYAWVQPMDVETLYHAINSFMVSENMFWTITDSGELAIKAKHDKWDHAMGGGDWPFMLDDIDKDRDEISERTTETFIDLADRALKSSRP